ncbi:hypothetical protein Acy02nite_69880 [Actinoplanes cyaneus]|uniref:Uncharacterized protein n=1 Tax=Actinoplanes cyaneus TaxID=52696 RepID=A0A919IRH1_9ACTN|nr:hypothetical protein [Actinoplanes cyaneus]GID69107.1 hypothetical protein Acy02nite_69880 [Actinoplanes cyaneus]
MTYPDPTAGPNYSPSHEPATYQPPTYQPPAYEPPAQATPPGQATPPAPRQSAPPQQPPAQYAPGAQTQYGQPAHGQPGQYGQPAGPGQPGSQGAPQVPPPAMPYQNWVSGDASHDSAQRQIDLAESAARGKRDITVGAIWFAVGGIITLATMASAASVYVVAWGPMLYGAYRIIKGVIAVRKVG